MANEIKELAKQTSDATYEIKHKIEGIQNSTSATVTEIEQITDVINSVNDIMSTISVAIEQLYITSREIANNVSQANNGITEIAGNIGFNSNLAQDVALESSGVNQGSAALKNNSTQIRSSAADLEGLARQLDQIIGHFKV